MSVLVSTAYMEEAQTFDWLAAIDGGKVLATGAAAQLMARTGTHDLESAFIGLLPEAMADAAREAGAEVRTEAPVERILVEGDRAAGVGINVPVGGF